MTRQVFNYTGAIQSFVVPAGVTSIGCYMYGGFATRSDYSITWGGYAWGTLAVTPGNTVYIAVGGPGARGGPTVGSGKGGWNGGGNGGGYTNSFGNAGAYGAGGAGGTDIRYGGNAVANRVGVAGGAGGDSGFVGAANPGSGGAGGATGGGAGGNGLYGPTGGGGGGYDNGVSGGGVGGYPTAGLTGGSLGGQGGGTTLAGAHNPAGPGIYGVGGYGGLGGATSSSQESYGGGGGGGGFYGGGGGAGGYASAATANGAGGGGGGASWVGGLTGGTTGYQGYNLSTSGGTGGSVLGWNGVGGFVVLSYNLPPNAPTINSPTGSSYIASDQANLFSWTHSDPDGDAQSAADMQWRVGAGAWTLVSNISTSATQSHSFASGYWTAQNGSTVEYQVRTYDTSSAVGPWSSSSFFNVTTTPAAPVITTPTSGATVPQTQVVNWTFANQKAYEVTRVRDNAGTADPTTVYSDTGIVNDTVGHSTTLNFSTNNRFEHIQVRCQDATSGLWSATADCRVDVIYVLPMTPTLVVTPNAAAANVALTITNPAPTGGAPTVTGNDLHMILADGTDIRIAAGLANNPGAFTYDMPIAGVKFYVVTYGNNGTSQVSATSAALVLAMSGVWLLDPSSPANAAATKHQWIYNDTGASESYGVEVAFTQYAGRKYPVADFGTRRSRGLSVNITCVDGSTDQAALFKLIDSGIILLYRDKKGRRMFGVISAMPITDSYGLAATQITLTVTDFTEGV